MENGIKVMIEFVDLAEMRLTQLDIIDVMQNNVCSELPIEKQGYYMLNILKVLINKTYEIADEAIHTKRPLKSIA